MSVELITETKRLARAYRKLYGKMTQSLCDQQRKVNAADGEELEQAQAAMWRMSSNYYGALRRIINLVPEGYSQHFWMHT